MIDSKLCPKCGKNKPLEDYAKSARGVLKRQTYCRACMKGMRLPHNEHDREYHKNYQKSNPEKFAFRTSKWRRKNVYKISEAEYKELLEGQKGLCAICGGPPTGRRNTLSIDHCHVTGTIRGLLCQNCNVAIGHFKDNTDLLKRAILYLNRELEQNE
jgi:hypothetical protein